MLVDRRVSPNRSKRRAAASNASLAHTTTIILTAGNTRSMMIQCARLPLDALNVSDLGTDEALNIDTALEIMQRWWSNYYAYDKRNHCWVVEVVDLQLVLMVGVE